jgi:hypothetical protein
VGLVASIRTYDILLVPLVLYPAVARREVVRRHGAGFVAGSLAALLPQFAVGTYYLGAPWANTHWGTIFLWTHPRLFSVLFSVKRGWWFWTPIAAIGCAGLVAGLWGKYRWFCGLSLVSIGGTVYLVAAWVDWAMGASFGHRGFVDCLPVLAVGIGLLLQRSSARPLLAGLLSLLVVWNLFLTWAHWNGYIGAYGATTRSIVRLMRLPFLWMTGPVNDSTSPQGLSAEVAVTDVKWESGNLVVRAVARNTGTAMWLSDLSKGQVYLDLRPFDTSSCEGKSSWEWREPIVTDVAAGESINVTVRIPRYRLTHPFHYLCAEMMGVAWFRDVGPSRPAVADTESVSRGLTPTP